MNSADDDAKRGFEEEWRITRTDDDDAGMTRGGPPACGGEWRA
jgi:hypothetical protein